MTSQIHNRATSTHAVVLDDSSINGRKGPSYDWQALLVPAEPVFEASLQMMLAAPVVNTRSRKVRRRS